MAVVVSGGAASGGARIEVDPEVLIRAGQRLGSIGTQLGMLSGALGAALGSGIASGMDPAGLDFGLQYGRSSQEFADGLAKAASGFKSVGYMLEATGYNYQNADAASTINGAGPTGGVGDAPAETTPADIPAGPNLAMVPPPFKWSLILPFLRRIPIIGMFASAAMTWPSGNPSLMRLTAAQWRNFGQGLSAFDEDIPALKAVVSLQEIPEGAKIGDALTKLGDGLSILADSATTLAQLIEDFANGVQDTQDAIRRLLDRISLDGLWDTVTGFLTGEGDDILREVARDVGDVLENFQSQVKGIVGLLSALTTAIGDAVSKFQDFLRPILVEHLGEDVGGALADAVTLYTDFQVGALTGLIGTVSGTVAMADPDTWKGMAEVAMSVAEDPSTLPGVLANMGKEFVAWEQLTGEHPGRGVGEAGFNIGTLFVPGGPLTKTGTVAKGLTYGSRLLDEGRLPRLTDLPGIGPRTPNLDGLGDLPGIGSQVPDVPDVRPGTIPESVIGPVAPNGVDAPASPRGVEAPAGPPDPPGPTGTPSGGNHHGGGDGGGDGPPPDSPGRPVGPPDSGPGRVDGPATQSPSSGPVDSPRFSEPPAPSHAPSYGDQTTPTTQHAPDSSSPTSTLDGGRSTPDPAPSPGEHAAPDASGNGHAAEQPGSGRGAGDDVGYRPDGNDAYRPETDEYSGRPDAPAHTPAPEQHSAHERPAPDGSQTREQPQSSGDGDGVRNEPVGTTPGVMPGVSAPMGSHAPGATHSAADNQSPANKTPTPDTTTRHPDTKTPHGGSPDGTRAQSPGATGPEPARTPTAPVRSTATQPVSDAAGEPIRSGPDPRTPGPGENTRDNTPTPHPETDATPDAARDNGPGNQSDPSAPQQDPSVGNIHDDPPDPSGPLGNPSEARVYGPGELRPVEDHAYQTAVENALRDARGDYLVHADPRTNDYGNLVNDGGHTVAGRSNNCLDCSLSALASFRGDPTVSAPRYPDRLPNGTLDVRSGEQSGLQRASDWMGDPVRPVSPSLPIADQYAELHRRIAQMGPGSSALVVNEWHARNPLTGEPLHHADGRPVINGSHATVVVYPENAAGPVWWDPQMGTTSDRPPASMVERSASLWATMSPPTEGGHGHATGDTGSGTGVSGADPTERDVQRVSVREWMDLHSGHPSGGELGPRPGDGEPDHRQADRSGDGPVKPADGSGGSGVRGGETDGQTPARPSDLSLPMEHQSAQDSGGRRDDRVSDDGGIADRSARTDPTTSVDDREAHVHTRSDGLAVERGDVPRGVDEPSEPGSVAGSGHNPGVTGDGSDRSAGDPQDADSTPATRDENGAGTRSDMHGDNATREGPSHAAADQPTPYGHAGPQDSDGTPDGSSQEPHSVDARPNDQHPGSAWDSPTGQHAAQLLPADDSGYRIQPRDCEYLGISPEQVEAWANREAPLGMTPTEFKEFSRSLYDALAREGFTPEDLDLRLQGSSARFFSGEHKSLEDDEIQNNAEAQARMATWFGDDENRPVRRPFDSVYRLGVDPEPSDYDIQISSDSMVDACRQRWEADGSQGDLVHPKYGFISKKVFEKMFPGLWEWAEQWSERTGRSVVPALFPSSGPPDTSSTGISSHFRESDWGIHPEGSDPN